MVVMAAILISGLHAYLRLGKMEDPAFTIKTALIVTPYPGASPHEVEQQVTRVVETAVQNTDEVEHIRSFSRAGVSMVYVDMYEHNRADAIQQLWDMLRRNVQRCRLPPGAGPSQVYDDYSDVYGIFLALTGEGFTTAQLQDYADFIKRELMLVPDVKRIELFGNRTEQITIQISRAKCAGLGIAPEQIINVLNPQNELVNAGSMEIDAKRLRIQTTGAFGGPADIAGLLIQDRTGSQILLKDLADISRGYVEPPEPMMRFNGRPAIGIAIAAASGANVVTMGDAIQARIDELMADLPVGIALEGVYYQSRLVKGAIKQFMTNLLESVGIVIAVLLISMGFRSGLIIAGNLILSILGTLLVMQIWCIELQRISLAALILVMGMIVDNAIVVTDATLTRLQQGELRWNAIAQPPRMTAWPLLGATVIACLAFLPIFVAPVNAGEYCASLFLVVSIALMISWVLSMSQTPVFCYYFLKVSPTKGSKAPHSGLSYRLYQRILSTALTHRTLTLLIMAGLLAAGGFGFQRVPQWFFAESDRAQFFIDYRRPEGTRIQAMADDLAILEAHLGSLPEVKEYAACIGQGAPRFTAPLTPPPPAACFGQMVVNVHDYNNIDVLIEHLESWFMEHLPDGEPHMWKHITGPTADYKVEVRFFGPDPKVLRHLAEQAKAIMRKDPRARNICDDWRERVPVLETVFAQQKARAAGVERRHLADTLLGLEEGLTVGLYREKDDLIPVKVRFDPIQSTSLETLPVWGNKPASTPLCQVINRQTVIWEDPIIWRYDRRRVIRAQCDPVRGVTADTLLKRLRPAIEAIPLPPAYSLSWEGEDELSRRDIAGLQKFLPATLIGMSLILVFLFNSVRKPLIIILTVPLSIVGIALGLLVFRMPFGFLSMLGVYSLIGMLIKNAVVLIDQITVEIKAGKAPDRAIMDSCTSRMRPVMMASMTTILGMIPLVSDAMFGSMAVTIMCGLAFATLLTLLVVPVLYSLFFRQENIA
jgi:multidrug efflux pump subunit AcrB